MCSSTLRRFSQRLTMLQLNSAATSSIRTPHVYDQTATIPEVRKIHTNTLSSVLSADVRTYRSSTASSSKNPLSLCGSSSGTGKPTFLSHLCCRAMLMLTLLIDTKHSARHGNLRRTMARASASSRSSSSPRKSRGATFQIPRRRSSSTRLPRQAGVEPPQCAEVNTIVFESREIPYVPPST